VYQAPSPRFRTSSAGRWSSGLGTVTGPSPGDAGLLPIRQLDRPIGLTQGFTAAPGDARDHDSTEQSDLEMVRSGACSMLADCEDQNDHDVLRTAPVFRLVVERPPDDTARLGGSGCPSTTGPMKEMGTAVTTWALHASVRRHRSRLLQYRFGRSDQRAPPERSAKLPGPPARTLKLEKPGWRPRSVSAVGSARCAYPCPGGRGSPSSNRLPSGSVAQPNRP
jgi:hypothetical protein